VGSLWAGLLRQRGEEVTVYEKRPDPRRQDVEGGRSINLIVTSRGLNALEKAGLLRPAMELVVPVYGRMIHSRTGETMYQPYGQKNECNYSISRSALNIFLINEAEKAGAKIIFDHGLQDLDAIKKEMTFETPKGSIRANYEVMFGTDGAGSRVRKALAAQFPEKTQEDTEWLEADYKELTLPLGKDGKPQLKTDALHIWPRGSHMLMALANLDGSFTLTLYLPKTGGTWSFDRVKTANDVKALFESEFPDAIQMMPDYQKEFLAHPQGSLGTVRTSRWTAQDSVALMGDAAHAIVPFFGQGMNSGFEDATRLLQLWESSKSWKAALHDYDEVQRPNANAIADMALENWVEMRDKVADPRFLLRKKVEGLLEQKNPGLYKSRYGMITYTLVPYALAQKAGLLQDKILAELIQGIEKPEELPWEKADSILEKQWRPFVEAQSLDLQPYVPKI
jgi:kynurenine 3-monooxygenase